MNSEFFPKKMTTKNKEDFFLSLSASKQLAEWGCEIETKKYFMDDRKVSETVDICTLKNNCLYDDKNEWGGPTLGNDNSFRTYHLLEDVCVLHAKEFFGEKAFDIVEYDDSGSDSDCSGAMMCYEVHTETPSKTQTLLCILQKNGNEAAEKFFLDNTIFNPKNK